MPTITQLITDPISIVIFLLFFALWAWERFFPRQTLAHSAGWTFRGLTLFAAYFLLSSYLPFVWDETLSRYQLIDLTVLGTVGGAVVGFILYEAGMYIWHRALHSSDALWLGFHQMHHSAERIDVLGAFYFSFSDMFGWTLLSSLVLVLGVGITPNATVAVVLIATFFAIFQHANIKTPHWLGYIIQRPEMHALHHARGVHFYNFCDLSVIDMIGGTYRNPSSEETHFTSGFYDGASQKLLAMNVGVDINKLVSERPLGNTTTMNVLR